jgi:dihydroorotate dehydrogenase/Pyruvate/2-oxoacid:ferredoxin oxidoreductase delta subunit
MLLGLALPNPVMPSAGPGADSGTAIAAAAAGGAGAVFSRTVTVNPVVHAEPSMARVARDTLIHRQRGSARSFADWVAYEYPPALAAARTHGVPFIASLGYTAEDVRRLGPALAALGVDALELSLHETDRVQAVAAARALRQAVDLPVIAKLTPHPGEDLAELAAELEPYVDAFTCVDSFGPVLSLDVSTGGAALGSPFGIGYQSGASIRPIAQRIVFDVARRVSRPVIACGGITSGSDAIEMLMLGASAVQVCTHALLYGPAVYGKIAREMSDWLDAHGYGSAAEVSGAYLRKYGAGQRVVVAKEESPRLVADKCLKCSLCGQVCAYDAIVAQTRSLPVIDNEACFQCGLCVSVCPADALRFRPRDEVTMPGNRGGAA